VNRLVVGEHSRITRLTSGRSDGCSVGVEAHLYDRLRHFDRHGRSQADAVFDWRDGYARTTQWVGVVQVPGLQVEILPKTDTGTTEFDSQDQCDARTNLLYMLAVGGDVPVRSRDVARLATRKAPLSETLAAIFAERLRQELLLGLERGYLHRQENLRCFKGKLLISEQAQANAAHRERFYCRFDEFSDDIGMNRIFKAACRVLLGATCSPATQDGLRQCLLLLDGVSDQEISDSDFASIAINRQNQRFEDVLGFCRLVLAGRSPTIQAGSTRSFSLVFDMNKVFERFIAAVLCRYVVPRFEGMRIYPQAAKRSRHLMECQGAGILRLAPDILIEMGGRCLVMDTKWKLLSMAKRGLGGVSDGDLYQLYAYARRYGSWRNVLLYPWMVGLEARDFEVLDKTDGKSGERISIRHVGLHRNLYEEGEREKLIGELEGIVREGLEEV